MRGLSEDGRSDFSLHARGGDGRQLFRGGGVSSEDDAAVADTDHVVRFKPPFHDKDAVYKHAVGAVLVHDEEVVALGHDPRVQTGCAIVVQDNLAFVPPAKSNRLAAGDEGRSFVGSVEDGEDSLSHLAPRR